MRRRTGGYREGGTPVPIPNTVVKPFSSNDTLGAAPRENRTPPFHLLTWAVSLFMSNASRRMEELSIGEVARRTGLRTSAIRYYESIKLLPPPRRVSGQRRYPPETVQTLEFVQTARRIGFSLTEIQSLLQRRQADAPLETHWQSLVQHKLIEVQNVISQAQTMQYLLVQGSGCSCTTLEECIDCVLTNCQTQ